MEIIGDMLHTILSFLVIISIIVFIHEYGHYLIARLCGVKIETFSIGFGKEVFGFTDRHGTHWKFSVLPMGGYVKMYGDESAASTADIKKLQEMDEAERKISFHYKPLWQKSLIVFGGPLFNFLLTIIIFTWFIFSNGLASTEPVVGKVLEDSAALEAGLREDDRILRINDSDIETFQDISLQIATNLGEEIIMEIERDGEALALPITPRIVEIEDALGNTIKHPRIGILSKELKVEDVGLGGALYHACARTWGISVATLQVLGQFLTGQRDTEQLKGPIGIAQMSGQAAESGLYIVFWFMALLSANLGLVNLLPIPLLDGGHLMYYAVEAVSGRPLAQKVQEYGFKLGFILLASLMAFTIFNDLRNLW